MFYTPFLYEMNQLRIGIRTNVRPSATMTLCFRSPHASCKTDNWLGGKLLRLYTAQTVHCLLQKSYAGIGRKILGHGYGEAGERLV